MQCERRKRGPAGNRTDSMVRIVTSRCLKMRLLCTTGKMAREGFRNAASERGAARP